MLDKIFTKEVLLIAGSATAGAAGVLGFQWGNEYLFTRKLKEITEDKQLSLQQKFEKTVDLVRQRHKKWTQAQACHEAARLLHDLQPSLEREVDQLHERAKARIYESRNVQSAA